MKYPKSVVVHLSPLNPPHKRPNLQLGIVEHVSSRDDNFPERHLLVDLQRLELFQHQQRVELLCSLQREEDTQMLVKVTLLISLLKER